MPLPVRTWGASYETAPPGSESLGLTDDRIRETRTDASERGNPEHHWDRTTAEAFAGEHRMGSARICRGTAAQRAAMQFVARTTDILPGTAGHEGGVDNSAKINNPNGLVFYEEDTGLTYFHNGTAWAFLLDFDFLAVLATTFRTRGVMAFRVKSPTTAATLKVNVNGGLYVDIDGTVREYAGDADFALAAADATNPRIDLLYLAGTTLTKVEGTPAGSPTAPAIPGTAFPLAYLFVRATSTVFEEADGGGTKSYLYKDLRGIVSKPPRVAFSQEKRLTANDSTIPTDPTTEIPADLKHLNVTLTYGTASKVSLDAVFPCSASGGGGFHYFFIEIVEDPDGIPVVIARGSTRTIVGNDTIVMLPLHALVAGWSGTKSFGIRWRVSAGGANTATIHGNTTTKEQAIFSVKEIA